MSIPSFSNIDRWLFERMEGNLSTEQLAQLQAFLLKHPELDVDQDMWELAKVDAEELVFPNQQRLLKRERIGWYAISGYSAIAIVILIGLFIQFSGLENVPLTQVMHPDSAQKTATLPTLHPTKSKLTEAAANSEFFVKTKKSANKRTKIRNSFPSNTNFSPLKAFISSNTTNNLTLNLTRNFENTEKQQFSVEVHENFPRISNTN